MLQCNRLWGEGNATRGVTLTTMTMMTSLSLNDDTAKEMEECVEGVCTFYIPSILYHSTNNRLTNTNKYADAVDAQAQIHTKEKKEKKKPAPINIAIKTQRWRS